ncbi:MAG TPA: homoserine kinase [Longimicrobiaceae bacterium]|nr:homoserine kinase [Longimicrobiaceae bacterium]
MTRCCRDATERRVATAFAPSSVGNVGVGFDLLGHAVVALGDRVTVRRIDEPTVRICPDEAGTIPTDPAENTAGAGLLRLVRDRGLSFGFEVSVQKGIPLGSGMGGSAASAAAAIVAASALLPEPLSEPDLLQYGMYGEEVASGSYQADNLAPCLLGGLVLARPSYPPDVVRIPVPASLHCVIVLPQLRVDTRDARRVLPRELPLPTHVTQAGNLAGVIAGCCLGDLELIARSLEDVLVEPHRAPLVRGFDAVKRAAREAGALGCSLSGSGPSLFAWCDGMAAGEEIRERMVEAFAAAGVSARGWISPIDAPGARVEHVE